MCTWSARLLVPILGVLAAGVLTPMGTAAAAAPPSGNWYMVDLHQHSNVSGDARADLGIASAASKARGYNAVMVTDHDRGASFQIQGANGNYLSYSDQPLDTASAPGRWVPKKLGSATSSVVARETTTAHSGTYAIHVSVAAAAGSTTPARAMAYAKRGPSLRAGGITLDFWVFPKRIDATAGVDVSVSLGGDTTTGTSAFGYTANGTATPKKSTVLVWQLGKARAASTSALSDVVVNDLQYRTGVWNHYTVDVRTGTTSWAAGSTTAQLAGTGLNGLPVGDRPADYDVLSEVKMESASTGGTADAFFDDYVLRDLAPNCPAADFVYRNQLIDAGTFDGTNASGGLFKMFPAREMGQNRHTNQFNFDIRAPGAYSDTFSETTVPAGYGNDNALCSATNSAGAPWKFSQNGTDNIPGVQASGYPAQNNHPGITDSTTNVTATQAYNADLVEVLTGNEYSTTWDAVLQQNHIVIGTYGSDSHEGVGSGSPATNIYAPSLTLDSLMRNLFEGRAYGARNNLTGRLTFNLDGSAVPYPARYPVYVPSGTSRASVTLGVSGGIPAGSTVRWITNSGSGASTTSDAASGSYQRTFSVPLSGAFTYVRAEVRDGSGGLLASTEPIFFESVASMAASSLHVDRVIPTQGCACSVAVNKGITSLTSNTAGTLTGQMTNPAGSTVGLLGTSPASPTSVTMDGTPVPASTSLTAFQAATHDAWFYDPTSKALHLQDEQGGATSSFSVAFAGGAADAPPSVPANVRAATGATAGAVDVTWSASTDTDGTGVAGYRIYRDGASTPAQVGTVTSYTDTGLAGGSNHSYTVSSFDTAGNESAKSAVATATASAGGTSGTLTAVADAYVDSSAPTKNTGTTTTLRTDISPVVNSYVRFAPQGITGTVTRATLSIYANSSLSAGIQVCTAADGAWTETTLTSANAPVPDCSKSVIAKPAVTGARLTADVTSLLSSANSTVTFVLVGQSTTGFSAGSRESANPPQLTLTTSGSTPADSPPSVPGNVSATPGAAAGSIQVTWSASTDTDGTAVAGYRVYRDGGTTKLADVTTGTSFTDTGLTPGSQHSYRVSAFDSANLESGQSTASSATAAGGATGASVTVPPVADATVDSSVPTTNAGTAKTLRVDQSPVVRSYLRFSPQGLAGGLTRATLSVYANSSLAAGFLVCTVADNTWSETGVNASNAPVPDCSKAVAAKPAVAGSRLTVDVTSLMTSANGDVTFVFAGVSPTALSLGSRESTTPPQLTVSTTG